MPNIALMNRQYKDLNPTSFGYEACRPGYAFGPAIRDHYLIHYVAAGRGTFIRGETEYAVCAGMFFLIRPGEICLYRADKVTPWSYIWIGFQGERASQLDSMDPPVRKFPEQVFLNMKDYVAHYKSPEPFLAAELHRFFGELFSEHRPEQRDYVQRVVNYIDTMYMQEISVEEIASAVSLDRRYLSRIFRERQGVTIRDYITQVRIQKACEFLDGGMPVGEAARLVGSPDAANFSKLFHKHKGLSPKQYQLRGM